MNITRDLRSVIFFTLLTLIPFGASLNGQTTPTIASVQVHSVPTGARFLVDGYMYFGAQTFLWPVGSKHTLEFPLSTLADGTTAPYQESLDGSTRFQAASWVLSNGISPTNTNVLTVVEDPTITSIVLTTSVSYRVNLRFSSFPSVLPGVCAVGITPQDTLRPGLVVVGGTCFGSDADIFLPAGPLAVLAYPFPGWAFEGWSTNGGPPVNYSGTVTINGPMGLQGQFVLAKRVSFRTNPAGSYPAKLRSAKCARAVMPVQPSTTAKSASHDTGALLWRFRFYSRFLAHRRSRLAAIRYPWGDVDPRLVQ
jgi:hypothetical protein